VNSEVQHHPLVLQGFS